ncbi:hypothetical protein [Streptomyces sp. NBC_01429]|uniref:hypothetical protein n=1 Tax=Streptomyces sp. NBC_01429 TaxID=2903862 RepID=UPI002E298EA8|nr:hypothetical protein [Streptomyces sp. NBC_01429]
MGHGASASGVGQAADEKARRRLNEYACLSAPEWLEHAAIMQVFCGTLLADLAVPDIMANLRQAGASAAGLDPNARHPHGPNVRGSCLRT